MRRATSCHAADFLRAKHFGEVVEHQDKAGIGAARTERADGDGEVQDASGDDGFDFAGDHAHAQRAPHQQLHGARCFGAQQFLERLNVARGFAEHARDGGVFAQDAAVGVQGNDAGGDVFQNRFHQLAAALEFLNGLLEISRELIDLRAASRATA